MMFAIYFWFIDVNNNLFVTTVLSKKKQTPKLSNQNSRAPQSESSVSPGTPREQDSPRDKVARNPLEL